MPRWPAFVCRSATLRPSAFRPQLKRDPLGGSTRAIMRLYHFILGVLILSAVACDGARDIVDNWPTFVVEGRVFASDGIPLKSVQVEARSFHGP